jgi:hypothetical protein
VGQQVSALHRRVSAVERAVEDARRRRLRIAAEILADELGISAEGLLREFERCDPPPSRVAELRAGGASEREIIERLAAAIGADADQEWQRWERVRRRGEALGLWSASPQSPTAAAAFPRNSEPSRM